MTSCPALCSHHRSKGQGVFHFSFFISTFIVIPDDTGFSLREPEILNSYHPLWITVWKTDLLIITFSTLSTPTLPRKDLSTILHLLSNDI